MAPVNWCPGCQTVLANEQVLADGTCERSGDLVIQRDLEQWFFRITAYADELLADLDDPGLARTGQDDATQLDRSVRRCRVRLAGGRARDGRSHPPGIHDPAGHQLRHDVCRGGARAPSGGHDHDRGPARRRRGGAGRRRSASRSTSARRRTARSGPAPSAAPSPAVTSSTRSPVRRYRSTWPTMCSCATAPAPSWPSRPRTSATGNSPIPTASLSSGPPSRPRGSTAGRGPGTGVKDQLGVPRRSRRRVRQAASHRVVRGQGDRATNDQLPPAGLAGVAPAVLGVPDPCRLLPGRTGSSEYPRTSYPFSPPTMSSSCPPANRR